MDSYRDPQQDLSAAVERKRQLTALAEDKNFIFLSQILQEQVDQLQQEILFTPCSTVDSALAQEYKKGQLEGRLAWEMVRKGYIESLEITINHLKGQLNDDDSGSTDEGSAP